MAKTLAEGRPPTTDKSDDSRATTSTIQPDSNRKTLSLLHVVAALLIATATLWTWLSRADSGHVLLEGYSDCHPKFFRGLSSIPGTTLVSLTASPVYDATNAQTAWPIPEFDAVSFCNVTYTYTHSGYGDRINVQVYLPPRLSWNGRFLGVGGGGFLAGMGDIELLPAISHGYAAAGTDGGLVGTAYPPGDPSGWATTADGLANWNQIYVFGPLSIYDMTRIGQTVTNHYYQTQASGHKPRSYYQGCSTGGRQGLMMAQRYPELYDGIIATAPATDYRYFYNFVLHQKPPSTPAPLPNLTTPEFLSLYARARIDLHSAISAWQPDLSHFSRAAQRPKMITWHGLADNLIAANHSREYYGAVRAHFRENRADYVDGVDGVEDFYRYFEVPGVKHCGDGVGPMPGTCFDGKAREGVDDEDDRGNALAELVRWVEEGTAPERMRAVSAVRRDLLEGQASEGWDGRLRRPVCAWPKRAEWRGGKEGKWWNEEGWECMESITDA